MDMIMENAMGSHWYSCMTSMAAPPGMMNANCSETSRIVMPTRMAQRQGNSFSSCNATPSFARIDYLTAA